MISSFYKDYSDKPIAIFTLINAAPLMAWPTIKSIKLIQSRQKHSRQAKNRTNKWAKAWA